MSARVVRCLPVTPDDRPCRLTFAIRRRFAERAGSRKSGKPLTSRRMEWTMKHANFERSERVEDTGDSADLRRCLWLTHMKSSTRSSTLDSLATLCTASGVDGELPITAIRQLICEPDPEVKAEVGARWAQVASDVRRVLRVWEDAPTRWLALRLRVRIPTFADAATAASLRLGADEAKRATAALEALANSDGAAIDEMPATLKGVLNEVGRVYAPALLANANAMQAGEKQWGAEIDGAMWAQQTFPCQGKCLQWINE